MNEAHNRERSSEVLEGTAVLHRGRLVFATPVCARILGYGSVERVLAAADFSDLVVPPDRSKLAELLARCEAGEGSMYPVDLRVLRPDGSVAGLEGRLRPVRWDGEPAVQIRVRDLRPRAAGDRQLMDALRGLAGNVAHQFNNFLLPIVLIAEMTGDDAPSGDKLRANMDRILDAAGGAKALAEALRRFGALEPAEPRPVSLGDLVETAVSDWRRQAPAAIEIRADVDPRVGHVAAGAGQIQEAVGQVIRNAVEALGKDGGTVEAKVDRIDDNEAGDHDVDSEPGRAFARITVRDDGPGMTPEVVARAFEPLFTTKKESRSVGLGLTMARAIVVAHGGRISIASAPGRGTSVIVLLPIVSDRPDRRNAARRGAGRARKGPTKRRRNAPSRRPARPTIG